MPLTVLSALARQDLDPWEEASALGRLPQNAATRRLASLIAALPESPSARPDAAAIAARLIALLPRSADSIVRLGSRFSVDGRVRHTSIIQNLFLYWIFIAFMLATQWVMTNRLAEPHLRDIPAPASNAVLPQAPPPSSGQLSAVK